MLDSHPSPTDPCQEALYTPNKGREVITLSSDASAQAETHVQGLALLPIYPGVPALPTLMHHPQNPSWGWPVGSVADTLLAFSAWRCPTYGEKVLQPLDPRADGRVGPDPIPEEPWALHGEGKHTGFCMIVREESEWEGESTSWEKSPGQGSANF